MTFVGFPYPPANKPLVDEEHAAGPSEATVKSPKSVAFPVDAIVTKSMMLKKL
jgi:hypothetical protein